MTIPRLPNLYIVGAPKAGTTAMHSYLAQHPQVFAPCRKEFHHFCPDLEYHWRVDDRHEYLSHFRGWAGESWAIDASVFYLYSQTAAQNIHREVPEARILIMLREPAELLHSLHRQWLKTGYENLVDFEKALAADGLRARGASMPRHSVFPWGLAYSGVCRFTDQVSRYFETFGRDNVRVILYDDFKRSPESEYRRTLHFLGIDDAVPPHLGIVNRGHDVRFHGLNRLVRRGARHAGPAGRWLPRPLRRAIKSAVDRVNLRPASGGLRPEVRRALQHQYSVEIENLAALLNRDLSSWLSDDSRPKMHNSGRTAVGVGNAGEEVFADLPEARSKQEG